MIQLILIIVNGIYLGVIEESKLSKVKAELKEKTNFKEEEIVYLSFTLNKVRYPQRTHIVSQAESLEE